MLTHYMHVHFPFYFTHSLDRFLTTLDLHVQILNVFILLTRYSMRLDMLRELEFLSTYLGIIVFLFISVNSVVPLILYTLLSVVILFLYSFDIMCEYPI